MKKIVLLMLLLLPFFVYADDCPIEKDESTALDRTLYCDEKNMITTTYKTEDVEVLKNDVCTITCNETVIFSIDPAKKVLAGMSFNYPLYVSGERKCSANYNYKAYETGIKQLVNDYSSLTGTAKATKGNELTNYYEQKKNCDEFTKIDGTNKYKLHANVKLSIETSNSVDNMDYVYKDISEYNSVVNREEISYSACDYNETTRKCTNGEKTIEKWNETARIFGKYTMKDTYIESYTGETLTAATLAGKKYCNAEDRYFTSFNELTRPKEGDLRDTGYRLTLVANNIGNNLIAAGDKWNLTANCSYKVNNLFTPQGGTLGEEDDNYDDYGNQAFLYRIIDLENPFPNDRTRGANWSGINISKIIKDSKTTSSLERFIINLSGSNIKRIRDYNLYNGYNSFSFDYDDSGIEKSYFIENFNFIDRK